MKFWVESFFFKQKTAYEMESRDWSSDVCSSDLQEMRDYVKRPNLGLIGVREGDEENESKLKKTFQDIIQENYPHLARQANTQMQEIDRKSVV